MAALSKISSLGVSFMLALAPLLAACGKETGAPAPAEPTEAPAPAPAEPPPAPASEVPPPDATEPAPSPAPTPPPPTEPSAVPKPTSAEPALDAMLPATASAKLGVPVDLRYQFESEPVAGQPVTLHLAAVPRVPGTQLNVSIKPVPGLQVGAGPLEIRKATAGSAYRQQLSVTRLGASAPEVMRVLVTMDLPEGAGFGYYSIPLVSGKTAQKQHSDKHR